MIENYVIHEQIGQGEYGKVYRAVDSSTSTTVAIKVIETSKLNDNPKLLELCLTEIKVLQQLSYCPYIIHFIQLIKTPIKYYFVYELCQGGPLDKLLMLQGHFTEQKALQVFWQLIQAFKTLRQHRIMHRDLKPSNILIHNGTFKLGDFGFCKPLSEQRSDVTGTMLGSPIYMAPEVLRGQNYDEKADIWSLGCVLYELLVGRCPFEEKSIARLITAQDQNDWSIPPEFHFQSQVIALLKSMLIKDSMKRCTWDYLFKVPLTKDGEFTGEFDTYENQQRGSFKTLKALETNINTQNYATYNHRYNYPEQNFQKFNQVEYLKTGQNENKEVRELKTQTSLEKDYHLKNDQISSPRQLGLPPKTCSGNNTVEPEINILHPLIIERSKIQFMCKVLNNMVQYNLLEKAPISSYFLFFLINKRAQLLLSIIKNCNVLNEIKDNDCLNDLLQLLKRRNNQKKLSNNFEFVRLVDTMEKELSQVKNSHDSFKEVIERMNFNGDALDQRELQFIKNLKNEELTPDQMKQMHKNIQGYVNQTRSSHYLSFIDYKNENDKHVVLHANEVLDCLQVDKVFAKEFIDIKSLQEFYEDIRKKSKQELNERFENLQQSQTVY